MSKNIYFIEAYKNDIFEIAYAKCKENNFKVFSITESNVIISFQKCDKNSLFVFSKFEGKAFKHLKSLKMSIFGPSVILYCINRGLPLPFLQNPIYTMVMSHIKITTSQIEMNEQNKLFRYIEMMGGHQSKDLTESVDVLLTDNVTSGKYHMAHTCKMKVFKPEWTYYIWSLCSSKVEFDIFDDAIVKMYTVPALNKLNICLSGFNIEEKKYFINQISLHGGIYCECLKRNITTILISKTTITEKYKFAILWNFEVVTVNWLTDSILKGFCQSFSEYKLYINIIRTKTLLGANTSKLNELHQDIFVNCKIGFIACDQDFINKWSYIIKNRGGNVIEMSNKNKENITHIISGDGSGMNVTLRGHLIKKDWLEKCLEEGRLIPIENYILKKDKEKSKIKSNLPVKNENIIKNTCNQNSITSHNISVNDSWIFSEDFEEDSTNRNTIIKSHEIENVKQLNSITKNHQENISFDDSWTWTEEDDELTKPMTKETTINVKQLMAIKTLPSNDFPMNDSWIFSDDIEDDSNVTKKSNKISKNFEIHNVISLMSPENVHPNKISFNDSWTFEDDMEELPTTEIDEDTNLITAKVQNNYFDNLADEDFIYLSEEENTVPLPSSSNNEENNRSIICNDTGDLEELPKSNLNKNKNIITAEVQNNYFDNLADEDFIYLSEEENTVPLPSSSNNEENNKDIVDDFTLEELELFSEFENDTIPSTSCGKNGLFKNCVIAFFDCHSIFVEKWKNIILSEGGKICTLLNEPNNHITHVIVNDYKTLITNRIETLYIVKEWLEISLKNCKLHSTEDFLIKDEADTCFDDDEDWETQTSINKESKESSITTVIGPKNETIIFNIHSSSKFLFRNLKFFLDKALSDSSSKNMIIEITKNSGKISDKPEKCNFIVTRLVINHPYKCLESYVVVTEYYILQCILKQHVLSVNSDFLFQPFICDENSQNILSQCVLCIKGFINEETDELKRYSVSLGAKVQEEVVTKECRESNSLVTTHIVVKDINVDGIKQFIITKIPIVSKSWLEKCGIDRCFVNTNKFLLIQIQECQENDLEAAAITDLKPLSSLAICIFGTENFDIQPLVDSFINLGGKLIMPSDVEAVTHMVCGATLSVVDVDTLKSINHEHVYIVSMLWLEKVVAQKKLFNEAEFLIYTSTLEANNEYSEPILLNRFSSISKNILKRNNSAIEDGSPLKKSKSSLKTEDNITEEIGWSYRINEAEPTKEEKEDINVTNIGSKDSLTTNEEVQDIRGESSNENTKPIKVSTAIDVVAVNETPKKIIILCSKTLEDRVRMKNCIEILGGELSDQSIITERVSHLIITAPNRSEKCLSAIAGGKWILHPSYIKDSASKGVWLNEELYEWGNPRSKHIWKKNKDEIVQKLSNAGFRWREKGGQIFTNWKVLFVDLTTKRDKILNILRIGGAKIINTQPHETVPEDVTHAFYKSSKDLLPDNILPIIFKWLKLEMIPIYIMEKIHPDESKYYYGSPQIASINNRVMKLRFNKI